jgi:hypothetical protein
MRRLLVLLGLVAAFAVPMPTATAASAPAVAETATPPVIHVSAPAGAKRAALAVTAKIHHYNMCGAWPVDACTEDQADNAEDLLHFLAVVDGAWFISVNEICEDAFRRLTTDLQAAGTMVFSLQEAENCDGEAFGNAIIHPGGVRQDGTAWYFPTQDPDKDCTNPAPKTECRTGLCLKLGTFAGPMAQCTAHLDGGSTDRTVTQSAEYAWIARSWVEPGRRLSLAGDFNLEPTELHPVYNGMVDLVLGDTHDIHEELTKQIDYIFIEPVGTWLARAALCTGAAEAASDHCYTAGDWHL